MLARIGRTSRGLVTAHSRSLSSKAADKIQQKGAGDEAAYFNRKDKEAALRLLRKLE